MEQNVYNKEGASNESRGDKNCKGDKRWEGMRALGGRSRLSVHAMNFNIPTDQGVHDHVKGQYSQDSWRYKVLKFLHSNKVQIMLIGLLLLDVIILFVELLILAIYPHCSIIVRDAISCCPVTKAVRFLQETTDGSVCELPGTEPAPEYEAGCNENKWEAVDNAETAMFALTITILSIFMIELTISMIALTPQIFFRQFFFLLDFVIITVSLILEVIFHVFHDDLYQSLAGVLVVFRLWRFVRIGHGIMEITNEIAHKEYAGLQAYTEALEELLKEHSIPLPPSEHWLKQKLEDGNLLSEIERAEREKLRKSYELGASRVEEEKANAPDVTSGVVR
jgi:Ion transport protein